MKLSVRFFSSLYISLLCASVSSSVLATQTEKPERWFEVEVILFKQLSDKKALKEQFPDHVNSTNLPQYKKHFDLLTPYLQPNLTNIKQFMPLCSDNKTRQAFVESLPRIQTPFSKALNVIEHVNNFEMPEFTTENKATMQQIERVFDLREELASPLFSTQNICIISPKDIENLFTSEQLANFQLDAFDIKALPTKLNILGTHISDSPYLIADESLLLADIKQRLQWSKEFKPLLHFGWRQVAVTRSKAIPLKLYAGEHIDYQYQQALNKYQSALAQAKHEEQAEPLIYQQLNSAMRTGVDRETVQTELNKDNSAQIKQQQLTQIFNELKTLDKANINDLISELERQEFEELIAIEQSIMDENKQLNVSKPPIEPLQPWFLDGFFKVHLDHYLYITADFNILAQSFVKNTEHNSDKASMKLINFSQNKRVITGEIHYFDHPYIGMLVQIRRFDPSKPKEEAVTQVVN
ncbi:MAG: hypothetical protein JKX76_06080 [Colwellia sp.]|nr:hypothetical protein [Colwellia sp.]